MLLIVNENVVQWALAVIVGNYSMINGFKDAFEYFSIEGYLFFTAFRLIPYLILGLVVKSFIKKKRKIGLGIGWGGLVGIVFMIIWGSWFAQLPYYTDEHVSSTTAIAFIFIPIYAIVTGLIGGVIGGLMSLVLTNKSPSS